MSWPLRKRTYNVDDTFFDVIDTEAKAYILGLLCADGYLIRVKGKKHVGIGIDLKYTDVSLLEIIRREMRFEGSINTATHGMRRITISSKPLYDRLIDIGFSSKKSYELKALSVYIPQTLYNHFFRGHFDGDGSFTFEKNTTWKGKYVRFRNRVNIRGTEAFLKYLETMCPIPFYRKFNKTSVLYISDRKTLVEFREWLYKDATIYLQRKHDVIPNTECAVLGNRHVLTDSNRLETPSEMEGNKGEPSEAMDAERLNESASLQEECDSPNSGNT